MPELVIATTATSNPMGAQAYEDAIAKRAQAALDQRDDMGRWQARRLVSRSLRSTLPGDRRLPMGRLGTASARERRALGRLIWPRDAVLHRMDLILPPSSRGPNVATLHDVVAWLFEDESRPVSAAQEELRAADAVICVSEFTAGEAERLLGLTRTTVVPNGVGPEYFEAQPLTPEQRAGLSLEGPYVLYAGGSAKRKNLPALAEAWHMVSERVPEHSLALAGSRSQVRDQLFRDSERVQHLGRVADSMMPALVAGAAAVVVPSLYEGFGLPALEAMAAGVPLVASNRSSLPEVVGDGGVLVDPTGDGLAAGLEHALSGTAEIRRMVCRGAERAAAFTWDRSAERHAAVWASVA